MNIRPLSETYAVSPQISPGDLPAIRDAGYTTVIDNRPDGEIPSEVQTEAMRAAALALGLEFVTNPVVGGQLTMANVEAQGRAIAAARGPVLAYCASGNRSSIVWALSQAGTLPAAELIARAARHGYQIGHLEPQIEALAAQKSVG
ncbi:TIGR01244 family sulfur transferase [Pseudogemmobacter humi]|uniref:Beta-lactamase hydrolase-like protein n=1 Tax=Pseudogemmobacter humi TaxID=2483812 RepID=A0A3P5XSJ0_9RHOB|nr:TIGR01244 family sulfur transferase [Pseudogemmobacter humi]VDC31999.1 Beta-lactamase hydrolase-like protein [Pseudogemmobacter humi]